MFNIIENIYEDFKKLLNHALSLQTINNQQLQQTKDQYHLNQEQEQQLILLNYQKFILDKILLCNNTEFQQGFSKEILANTIYLCQEILADLSRQSKSLPYTIHPECNEVLLLCDFAELIANYYNCQLPEDADKHHAIAFLLPDVFTTSYAPNTTEIFSIDEQKQISICREKIYPDLTELPLPYILKTHMPSNDGLYLIPIAILATEFQLTAELERIPNFYYDLLEEKHNDEETQASKGFYEKTIFSNLANFSNTSQAIVDLRQEFHCLNESQGNFLWRLQKLLNAYRQYSISGSGKELEAGDGYAKEIALFFYDYLPRLKQQKCWKDVPDEVKTELAILPNANLTNVDDNIDTCFFYRATGLSGVMTKHEATLRGIGTPAQQEQDRIYQAFQLNRLTLLNELGINTHNPTQQATILTEKAKSICTQKQSIEISNELLLAIGLDVILLNRLANLDTTTLITEISNYPLKNFQKLFDNSDCASLIIDRLFSSQDVEHTFMQLSSKKQMIFIHASFPKELNTLADMTTCQKRYCHLPKDSQQTWHEILVSRITQDNIILFLHTFTIEQINTIFFKNRDRLIAHSTHYFSKNIPFLTDAKKMNFYLALILEKHIPSCPITLPAIITLLSHIPANSISETFQQEIGDFVTLHTNDINDLFMVIDFVITYPHGVDLLGSLFIKKWQDLILNASRLLNVLEKISVADDNALGRRLVNQTLPFFYQKTFWDTTFQEHPAALRKIIHFMSLQEIHDFVKYIFPMLPKGLLLYIPVINSIYQQHKKEKGYTENSIPPTLFSTVFEKLLTLMGDTIDNIHSLNTFIITANFLKNKDNAELFFIYYENQLHDINFYINSFGLRLIPDVMNILVKPYVDSACYQQTLQTLIISLFQYREMLSLDSACFFELVNLLNQFDGFTHKQEAFSVDDLCRALTANNSTKTTSHVDPQAIANYLKTIEQDQHPKIYHALLIYHKNLTATGKVAPSLLTYIPDEYLIDFIQNSLNLNSGMTPDKQQRFLKYIDCLLDRIANNNNSKHIVSVLQKIITSHIDLLTTAYQFSDNFLFLLRNIQHSDALKKYISKRFLIKLSSIRPSPFVSMNMVINIVQELPGADIKNFLSNINPNYFIRTLDDLCEYQTQLKNLGLFCNSLASAIAKVNTEQVFDRLQLILVYLKKYGWHYFDGTLIPSEYYINDPKLICQTLFQRLFAKPTGSSINTMVDFHDDYVFSLQLGLYLNIDNIFEVLHYKRAIISPPTDGGISGGLTGWRNTPWDNYQPNILFFYQHTMQSFAKLPKSPQKKYRFFSTKETPSFAKMLGNLLQMNTHQNKPLLSKPQQISLCYVILQNILPCNNYDNLPFSRDQLSSFCDKILTQDNCIHQLFNYCYQTHLNTYPQKSEADEKSEFTILQANPPVEITLIAYFTSDETPPRLLTEAEKSFLQQHQIIDVKCDNPVSTTAQISLQKPSTRCSLQ